MKFHIDNVSLKPAIRTLLSQNGIQTSAIDSLAKSFMTSCITSRSLNEELSLTLKSVLTFRSHSDDLFPFILNHAFKQHPELKYPKIFTRYTDLSDPQNWYPEARQMRRRIIYHAGPTNSGKTYTALTKFFKSKSGIYCTPLKLLALEIYNKASENVINNILFGMPKF